MSNNTSKNNDIRHAGDSSNLVADLFAAGLRSAHELLASC